MIEMIAVFFIIGGFMFVLGTFVITDYLEEKNKSPELKIDDLLYRIDQELAVIESLKRQIEQLKTK